MYRILLLALSLGLAVPVSAQVARVITLADSLVGGVGGVAVDRLGNIYSADFMDTVWRIKPDGRVTKFAQGLYGPSGNFFDSRGNLMQANFFANTISRIDRMGQHEVYVDEGLNGPVGLTITADGSLYACNCSGNTISKIGEDRVAREFASGDLFQCPNGITSTPDGTIYVVNFSDGNVLEVDVDGHTQVLATIPGPGLGHIVFAGGELYVTAFQSHQLYQVGLDGEVQQLAGSQIPGEVSGSPSEASFTFPNGIATNGAADRLFVNDYINRAPPGLDVPPVPLANIRLIKLANLADRLTIALQGGGIDAMKAEHAAFRANPATAARFTQRQLNFLGYQLMQQGNMSAAVAVFELNVADYPTAFNPHDSLGEAYLNAGRTEDALASYRKSLELNPGSQSAKDAIARIQAN